MIALDMDVIVESGNYNGQVDNQRLNLLECSDQTYPQWTPGFLNWLNLVDEEVWVVTDWDSYLSDLILDEIIYWIPRERRVYCKCLKALKWRIRGFDYYVTRRNLNVQNLVKFRGW